MRADYGKRDWTRLAGRGKNQILKKKRRGREHGHRALLRSCSASFATCHGNVK
jgi:hypothetical protein